MINVIVEDHLVHAKLNLTEQAVSPPSLSGYLQSQGKEILQQRADARFGAQGDDASGPWKALAYPTQQIRYWQGFGPTFPINVRYGDLRDWMTSNHGTHTQGGASAAMVWPGDASGEMDDKFRTAQAGRSDPSTPARPVAAANAVDLGLLLSGITNWVSDIADLEAAS